MLTRLALFALVLGPADAAIILNSQFRSVAYGGSVQSTAAPGLVSMTAGDCVVDAGTSNDSDVSTAGFTGRLESDGCIPVFYTVLVSSSYHAEFTLTSPQWFSVKMSGAAADTAVASSWLTGPNTNLGFLALDHESALIDELVLLAAGYYTITAFTVGGVIFDGEGLPRGGSGSSWFDVIPLANVPEPSSALLLLPALALFVGRAVARA